MIGVKVPERMLAEMIAAAAAAAGSREACGLVAFDPNGDPSKIYPLTNIALGPERFLIDPTEQFRTIQEAERHGWSIGGVFHSHPSGPPEPSETDLAAPLDPEWVSFIVSPDRGGWGVRAFSIRDGSFTESPVRTADDVTSLR